MDPLTDKPSAWINRTEVLDPAVLNRLFEGLSNLDTERYEAVSQTLHTKW